MAAGDTKQRWAVGAVALGSVAAGLGAAEWVAQAGPVRPPTVNPAAGVLPPIPVLPPRVSEPPKADAPPPVELLPTPAAEKVPAAPAVKPLAIPVPDLKPTPAPSAELPLPKVAEPPKLDIPKFEPSLAPPAIDVPKVDVPKIDPPKVEIPKLEAPKPEPAKVEVPKIDPPKLNIPTAELPAFDPPKVDVPAAVVPKAELPKIDAPKIDPPKIELPIVDVPKVELPKFDPPKLDMPSLDLPKPTLGRKPAAEPTPPAQPAKSAETPEISPPPLPEIPLRSSEPRLNVNSAEPAPPGSSAPVLAAPAALQRDTSPAPASAPTPPGDAPMPLSVRHAALSAVLGAAMIATPSQAADDGKMPPAVKPEEWKAVQDDLKELKELIKGRQGDGFSVAGLSERVAKLEKKLDDMEKLLLSINGKLDTRSTTSGASPVAGATGAVATATTGFVKIVNEYPAQISIVINDTQSYRVDANTVKEVPVPAGTFKYLLLGSPDPEKSKPVKAGETVPLYIR